MKKGITIIVVGLVVLMGSSLWAHQGTNVAATPLVKNMTLQNSALNNSPPTAPVIGGETNGKPNVGYNYTFASTDPDGDNVYYFIEWGDGCPSSGWLGPYPSGQTIIVAHTFPRGTWTISCQAKDIYNATSDFGTLKVVMPLSLGVPSNGFLALLFARFPQAFPILRLLLGF